MKTTRTIVLAAVITLAFIALAGTATIYSGVYNVAADDPHSRPMHAVLETARERSIATRAAALTVPPEVNDPARIRQGAGNYNAMCTGCHLTPGSAETELSKGLYPPPPNLTREQVTTAEAFWVIKHGIKASGMPAWGKSMDDDYIWNMAAFLQELPKLDSAQYAALVASSGGHSHGGGETDGHAHADQGEHAPATGERQPHEGTKLEQEAAGVDTTEANAHPPTPEVHIHADGKQHVHAPATANKTPAIAPDKASSTDSPSGTSRPNPKPVESSTHPHDHER